MVSSVVLPRLTVTPDDVASLRATAAALEDEVLKHYEYFITHLGRRVDRSKWKHARTDGDLHAYFESNNELGFLSSTPSPNEPQAALRSQSSVSRVMVSGTMPGTLEDALYGCSFRDTISLRTKEAYQRAFLDDSAVLMTIDGPTARDPFEFFGITWHLRTSRLAKPRDCLLLQHTHITTLSTGERIGVCLRHSIEHCDMPKCLDVPRVVLSSVCVYRPHSVGTVEVYGLEFLDEKWRRSIERSQRIETARDLLAHARVCDSSQKKKLHWLMRRRHREGMDTDSTQHAVDSQRCGLCKKSTSGLFSATGIACQLCTKHMCTRCSMSVDIVVDATTANVVSKPFPFCIECILQTKKLSALELAQDDVRAYAHQHAVLEKRRRTLSSATTRSVNAEQVEVPRQN